MGKDIKVPTQTRVKPLLCKLGLHKWWRHYEVSEPNVKYRLCIGCGNWLWGRSPQ